MRENILRKIIRKSGRKPSNCKCQACKNQCKTPCLGTPQDIMRLIDAGYGDKVMPTHWLVGMVIGKIDYPISMVQAIQMDDGWCVFHKNGLCELHNLLLKPTEGRLSHHDVKPENYIFSKGLAYNVAKEWLSRENQELVEKIFKIYNI